VSHPAPGAREARVTVPALRRMRKAGEKISMLTVYDYPFARIFDAAGIDVLLVGDSVGTCVQGHETTLPVTLGEMVYHTRMVARAVRRALVVGDMPFGSYQTSAGQAVDSACALVKEGAQAVKLEGGARMADRIAAIVAADVPVMGHIGLTPQSVHRMGGFRVQGRGSEGHDEILRDALAVQEAGAFSVVLEGIPKELGAEITASLEIPTLGIGAGIGCDGQVLVMHDLLGLTDGWTPRFLKRYAAMAEEARDAVRRFGDDVRAGRYPADEHSF
jgi:3-methyl-2-oxobutanoate hydroxymethyltransferase